MADKKAVPLRISEKLYSDLAAWAEDDFRSLNGQIEYLLTECVKQRRRNGGYVGKEIDKPLEVDLSDTNGNTNGNVNGYANAKKTEQD